MVQETPEATEEELEETATVMHKLGTGCLMVFGAPFLIIGLVLLYSGLSNSGDSGLLVQLIKLIAGGTLTFGFAAVMYWQKNSRAAVKESLRLKHLHPKEPWLWRDDWAAGEIRDNTPQRLYLLWMPVAGLVVIALAIPVFRLSGTVDGYFDAYPYLTYILAALLVLGFARTVYHALKETARVKKFDRASFRMTEVPARLGGRLRGRVETTLRETPENGASVRLECVALGAGRHRQDEGQMVQTHCSSDTVIGPEQLSQGQAGILVPIDMPISEDGRPYENHAGTGGQVRIRWRLIITAKLPGIDYRAEFQPPVFDLGDDGLVKNDFPDIAV